VTILFTTALAGDAVHEVLVGAGLLSLVGTLYLCTGLRFDFRQDLEHMELVKSWPLAPSAIFLATILPEVALVSLLLFLGILARAVATGGYHWALFLIVGFQPLATLAWVALDNAVFLYAPVRYTPGQEGALQHMGRSILLMLLRVTLFTVVFFVTAVPIWIVIGIYQWAHSDLFGFSFEGSLAAAAGISWLALCAIDGGLVLLGGRMLRRFDVARDRG
jgi:hypothetical protein